MSAPSICSFPKARSFAFISSSRAAIARLPTPTAPASKTRSAPSSAPGRTRCRRLWRSPTSRRKRKQLAARYHGAFSASYREHYPPATAIEDIRTIEGLSAARPLGVNFHGRPVAAGNCAGLKVWSHGRPIPLSDRVPVLENMGFRVVDERTYDIAPAAASAPPIWLHDMTLERADGGVIDLAELEIRARGDVPRRHGRRRGE